MKSESDKFVKNDEDLSKLEGLDAIFRKVPQSTTYPALLNSLTAGLVWTAGGMLLFMGNILAATPGIYENQWRRFYRRYSLLYHKFGNMVIFRSETYIYFVAQKTGIIRKWFIFFIFKLDYIPIRDP